MDREFRIHDLKSDTWFSVVIPETEMQLLEPAELLNRRFLPTLAQIIYEARKQKVSDGKIAHQ